MVNISIVACVKEGMGMRGISRFLKIAASTVIKRIRNIAGSIKKPSILTHQAYEVDELRTYVGNKQNECWVMYALNKETRAVVDFKVGRRTKANLKVLTDTLLLSEAKKIYTDGLTIYQQLIERAVHKVRRYGTNRIERKNLTLRTHLKRLNRRTICYSKSLSMLAACLKIYFWA